MADAPATPPGKNRPRRWLRRLFIIILFLYITLGAADLALEYLQQIPPATRLPPSWAQSESEITRVESKILQFAPGLLWELRPNAKLNALEINADGLHGARVPASRGANQKIVLVLGDGSAFGVGRDLNRDEAWPAELAASLRKRTGNDNNWTLLNFTVPCYSSAQALELYKTRALPLKPDILLVSLSAFPDSDPCLPGRSDAAEMQQSRTWLRRTARFADRFGLWRFFRDRFFVNSLLTAAPRAVVESGAAVPRVSVGEFESALTEIVNLQKSAGGITVLVAPPVQKIVLERRPVMADYNSARRRVAEKTGALFADPGAAFDARLQEKGGPVATAETALFQDLYHPAPNGHSLVAACVAGVIQGSSGNPPGAGK